MIPTTICGKHALRKVGVIVDFERWSVWWCIFGNQPKKMNTCRATPARNFGIDVGEHVSARKSWFRLILRKSPW